MPKLSNQTCDASSAPFYSAGHAIRAQGGSVHVNVADEIGQRIVRGDYPPGSILPNEAKWAETFQVSRSVVREAVKMLTAKSLLASRPKIGSRVEPRERWNLLDRDVIGWYATAPDLTPFLRMVQEVRHLVEPEAAALAATRRSAEEMAEIARLRREILAAPSPEAFAASDTQFHLAILAASGNDLILPLGVIVETGLRHLFQFLLPTNLVLRDIMELHASIERAIRLRRPDAARRAVRRLLNETDAMIAAKLAA